MLRRELLKAALGVAGCTLAARAWAVPNHDARMLIVFLRGGYDAANIVVPTSSAFYHDARPKIGIARPDASDPSAAIILDRDWGLHPCLGDTILPLFNQREAIFIPFVGSDNRSRSHFMTQDAIEIGRALGDRDTSTGFLTRLIAELSSPRPVSFTDLTPLIVRGSDTPILSLNRSNQFQLDRVRAELIQSMYKGSSLLNEVRQGIRSAREFGEIVSRHADEADRGGIPSNSFESHAQQMGRLMRTDFNLGFVDVAGWDTHVNQGGASGYLATKMGDIGRGVVAFKEALGPIWARTFMVVISEFGRTLAENGSLGTDHGQGSVYWVLGGGLRGGRFVGEQIRIDTREKFENRELPVLTDVRQVMAEIIRCAFGLGNNAILRVLPNVVADRLDLI